MSHEESYWEHIHQELALTADLLQTDVAPSQLQTLLAHRAEQLAVAVQTTQRQTPSYFLIFRIGDEQYGIDVQVVQTIVSLRRLTPVPGSPPHIIGVANVKGQVVSIIQLTSLFGLKNSDTSAAAFIIVVQAIGLMVGLLVDEVDEVLPLSEEQLATYASDDPTIYAVLPMGAALLNMEQLLLALVPSQSESDQS